MTEDTSTPPDAGSDAGFRRHGKRNRLALIALVAYAVLMSVKLAVQAQQQEDGWAVVTIAAVVLLICGAIIVVIVPGMSAWNRRRTEELARTAPVAVTMAPLGTLWADLRQAFDHPGEEQGPRAALRTAWVFTLTADPDRLTLWKGGAAAPDPIVRIDWRDIVRIDAADIADRARRQRGIIVTVGTPSAPTELTMALCSDGPFFRFVGDRARILSTVRALEDQRVRAIEAFRLAGDGNS